MQYKILHRPVHWRHWAGRECLERERCNQIIYNAICSQEPFAAGRVGFTEMGAILALEHARLWRKRDLSAQVKQLGQLSGVFGLDEISLSKFVDLYLKCAAELDLAGVWYTEEEEYLLRKYVPQAKLTKLAYLEPYYEEKVPWSRALKGKKVLVIHPFADTITSQYAKREKLWPNRQILPAFQLCTFKAVQTLCGENDERFPSWFAALDYMVCEIQKIDFDIAVIGCGAYGLPLASAIKDKGRQAIHLGGATQILFGIIGKRWEDKPFFQTAMNEYWVRPKEEEKPKNADQVEGGCYW